MFKRKSNYSVARNQNGISFESTSACSNLRESSIENTSQGNKLCHFNYKPFLGFIYTFLSSAAILLSSVFVKQLNYINSGQLSLVRNVGVFVGCFPIAVFCTREIFGPRHYWWLLCVRSFAGATSLYLNLLAYRILPMAETSIILSTIPALVSVLAHFYLKERIGWVQFFAILLTLAGMCLSIRLPELLKNRDASFDTTYITGLCCAFGCVVILSVNIISLRKMTDVHFSVVLIYFGALGALENGILTGTLSSFSLPYCGMDVVKVMLIGVLGFIGHCCMILSIQVEAAGIITTLKACCDMIVAMVFQTIFFDDVLDWYNVGGGFFVVVSVSMIGTKKWLQTLPEDSNHRKKFRWLLM